MAAVVDKFRGKKVLIVGIGKTGFKLIGFFSGLGCSVRVTDLKPIFDLNRQIKKLKRMPVPPATTFGEHLDKDFLAADVVVHSASVNPSLPQLALARKNKKKVYSEFSLANSLCKKPVIAVCGHAGRTVVAHMIGFALKIDGKKVFIGGTSESPFIDHATQPDGDSVDYVVVEASAIQMRRLERFRPRLVVFTNIAEKAPEPYFSSTNDYIGTKLRVLRNLKPDNFLVVNFDKLYGNPWFKDPKCPVLWYSRRSFVAQGVMDRLRGTHFHNRRIHTHVDQHSEFIVSKMRIVGQENRENLLAAVTACKALGVSDRSVQTCVERFPGVPHRLEFLMEKNGVSFYNDSKAETMDALVKSVKLFKSPPILIAGGKDVEKVEYEPYAADVIANTRILILVGECKERMNRVFSKHPQTFIVGSFEESILLAYQKSRMGDTILLSPGNPATDFFRDYAERGNYYKKIVYQL